MFKKLTPASVPHEQQRAGRRRPSRFEDQYAALLQQILANERDNEATSCIVGMTSCTRRSGVSTLATNLALHAAEVLDHQVLLVDANVEHPSMQKTFGVEESPGVVEALSGQALVLDCIRPSQIENLSLLTAGIRNAPLRGIYEPDMLSTFFSVIRDAFAFVVVDLAAVHELRHCHALASWLDGVVLVVEAERVKAEESQWAAQRLQQAGVNLLGAVFNKRRHHVPGWLYRTL